MLMECSVADTNNGRVEKFSATGTFLGTWELREPAKDNYGVRME